MTGNQYDQFQFSSVLGYCFANRQQTTMYTTTNDTQTTNIDQ